MSVVSSSPNIPPSPAWGFSAATAIRGEGVPICSRKKASVMRTVLSMSAGERSSRARRNPTWIVTRATRNRSPASIIATSAPPQRWARNSVWPGNGTPAAFNPSFVIGQVTIAAALPKRTSCVADRIYPVIATDPGREGRPNGTWAGSREERTATAIRPGPGVSSSPATASGTPVTCTARRRIAGSPYTTGRHQEKISSRAWARTVTSGPIPAGSPIVMAIFGGKAERVREGSETDVDRGRPLQLRENVGIRFLAAAVGEFLGQRVLHRGEIPGRPSLALDDPH